MGVLVWAMMTIACWHLAVRVPDRFWGGIVCAFLAALAGGLASGFALPSPGLPSGNPPGLVEAVFAIPGALGALGASYAYGSRKDEARGIVRP